MSRAIASARQRRAGVEPSSSPSPVSTSSQPPAGLTLPQVISLVDTRLIKLEQFMKETLENNSNNVSNIEIRDSESNIIDSSDPNQLTDLNDILEEYNNRFVLLNESLFKLNE
jgi:hypothetical protein